MLEKEKIRRNFNGRSPQIGSRFELIEVIKKYSSDNFMISRRTVHFGKTTLSYLISPN